MELSPPRPTETYSYNRLWAPSSPVEYPEGKELLDNSHCTPRATDRAVISGRNVVGNIFPDYTL